MDGQRNFADEPEPRWFPADHGYTEPDWRADDDRYRAESYGAPESRGGTGGETPYGGRDVVEDERFRDPLGAQSGVGSRYGESGPYGSGEAGRGADSGYIGGRPDAPGLPPQGTPPVTSGAPLTDPGGRGGDHADRSMDASTGSMPVVAGPDGSPHFASETIDRAGLRRSPAPGSSGGDGIYRSRRPLVAVLIVVLTVLFEIPALRLLLAGTLADPISASGVIAGTLMVIGLPILALGLHGLAFAGPAGDPARFWLRPPAAYLVVAFALLAAAGLAAA